MSDRTANNNQIEGNIFPPTSISEFLAMQEKETLPDVIKPIIDHLAKMEDDNKKKNNEQYNNMTKNSVHTNSHDARLALYRNMPVESMCCLFMSILKPNKKENDSKNIKLRINSIARKMAEKCYRENIIFKFLNDENNKQAEGELDEKYKKIKDEDKMIKRNQDFITRYIQSMLILEMKRLKSRNDTDKMVKEINIDWDSWFKSELYQKNIKEQRDTLNEEIRKMEEKIKGKLDEMYSGIKKDFIENLSKDKKTDENEKEYEGIFSFYGGFLDKMVVQYSNEMTKVAVNYSNGMDGNENHDSEIDHHSIVVDKLVAKMTNALSNTENKEPGESDEIDWLRAAAQPKGEGETYTSDSEPTVDIEKHAEVLTAIFNGIGRNAELLKEYKKEYNKLKETESCLGEIDKKIVDVPSLPDPGEYDSHKRGYSAA